MENFNTQIAQPNISDPSSLQHNWATDAVGCLRPTADYGIAIVCQVKKQELVSLDWLGTEFDQFRSCCLGLEVVAGSNATQWTMVDPCETQYCFTSNTTIASGFDECVVNATDAVYKKFDVPAPNVTISNATYRGECEYIDYDSIKKGVRTDDKLGAATNVSPRTGSWMALATAVAASVLVSGLL